MVGYLKSSFCVYLSQGYYGKSSKDAPLLGDLIKDTLPFIEEEEKSPGARSIRTQDLSIMRLLL